MMELYQEMLIKLLEKESLQLQAPGMQISAADLVEAASYQVLQNIKQIIADDSLCDSECFEKIEAIVCQLEQVGSGGGNRHDFG